LQDHHCLCLSTAYKAFWLNPQFGKVMLCPNSSLGNQIRASVTLHWLNTKITASQWSLYWAHAMLGMHPKHTNFPSFNFTK
jgi:hypothetical protein